MSDSSPPLSFSSIPIIILFLSSISIPLIAAIWVIQTRDGRRHLSLSFMFFWLLLVALFGILQQLFLQSSNFPFPLIHLNSSDKNSNETINNNFTTTATRVSLNNSTSSLLSSSLDNNALNLPYASLSAVSAMSLVRTWHNTGSRTTSDENDASVMQLCIFLAHIYEIQWFGVCFALIKWTWYLYRCLTRKLAVVDLRLSLAGNVAGADPDDNGNGDPKHQRHRMTTSHTSSTVAAASAASAAFGSPSSADYARSSRYDTAANKATAAGFRVHRPIRSLADLWARLPVFTITPFVMAAILVRDGVMQCLCCGNSRRKRTPSRRAEDNNLQSGGLPNASHETWMEWSSICEEEIARSAQLSIDKKAKRPFDYGSANGVLLPHDGGRFERGDLESANTTIAANSTLSPVTRCSNHTTATMVGPSTPLPRLQSVATPMMGSEQLTFTLASKTGTVHGSDHIRETLDERFAYDISGRRIQFESDTWWYKIKAQVRCRANCLEDLGFCIGIPFVVFLLRFIIAVEGRSYEIYPNRGGCRISRGSAHADWAVVLVMEVVITLVALLGIIFAGLSLFQFCRQKGAFNINVKTLTPSPRVLQLYDVTKVVRHLLFLCVGLNAIFCFARVLHLAGLGFNFTVVYLNPFSDQKQAQKQPQQQEPRGPQSPLPLFRLVEHDLDLFCVFVPLMMIIISFVGLGWTRIERWWSGLTFSSRFRHSVLYNHDVVDSSPSSPTLLPRDNQRQEQPHQQSQQYEEPQQRERSPVQKQPGPQERSSSLAHPSFLLTKTADERIALRMSSRQHLLRFISQKIEDRPSSSSTAVDMELESGVGVGRGGNVKVDKDVKEIKVLKDEPAIVTTPPTAYIIDMERSLSSTSTALASARASQDNNYGSGDDAPLLPSPASRASRASLRVPKVASTTTTTKMTTTTTTTSLVSPLPSPLPSLLVSETTRPSPIHTTALHDRAFLPKKNSDPNLIRSPSGRVRYDSSWLPSAPVPGRPSSPRMNKAEKAAAIAVAVGPSGGIPSLIQSGGLPINLTAARPASQLVTSRIGLPIMTSPPPLLPSLPSSETRSMMPLTSTLTPQPLQSTFSSGGNDCVSGTVKPPKIMLSSGIPGTDIRYDRVLEKLAAKKKKSKNVSSKLGKKNNAITVPRSTNISREISRSGADSSDNNNNDNNNNSNKNESVDEIEQCEIITMCSISLDGLIIHDDNEYDSMYQKMMTSEEFHPLAQTSATMTRLGLDPRTRRAPSRKGRRRSSVMRFANASSGMLTHSRQQSRIFHRRQSSRAAVASPYFHLVSSNNGDCIRPESDLYADEEDDHYSQVMGGRKRTSAASLTSSQKSAVSRQWSNKSTSSTSPPRSRRRPSASTKSRKKFSLTEESPMVPVNYHDLSSVNFSSDKVYNDLSLQHPFDIMTTLIEVPSGPIDL